MQYTFSIYGHENILSTHKKTFEFTKESELTKNGDCIVGVKADFELEKLKPFLKFDKVKITIEAGGIKEEIIAIPNKSFDDSHELVVRIGDFDSKRTFAVRADKASSDLSRKLVDEIRKGRGEVTIYSI